MLRVAGLHHVATICSDARRTLDFYVRVLGLRLVKRTVKPTEPRVAHFYCGDASGAPGSLVSLTVHEAAAPGRRGTGQVGAATMTVPPGALAYWRARLAAHGVAARGHAWMFGEEHLCFADPDGLDLALAEEAPRAAATWERAIVPAAYAIRRIRAIEIQLDAIDATAAFLVEALGFRASGQDGAVFRFRDGTPHGPRAGPGDGPVVVDLVCARANPPGAPGAGIVQHVGWRVADDRTLVALRAALVARGIAVTPPLDQRYFRAVAFEAPGGIGCVLATDGPGFTVDEPIAQLGSRLCLPPWLEPERDAITRALPNLERS
jgi:glyoxalase family protein